MTMTKKTLTAASLAIIAVPTIALAAPTVGDMMGTSEDEIRDALMAAGYEVQEIEIEDDELEAVVLTNGQLLELEISPETGMIVAVELEDEDDYDDDEDDDDDDTTTAN